MTNTESDYGKPGPDFHFDQTEHQYIYIDLMEYRDSNNIGDSLGFFRYEESHVIMFADDTRDGKTVFLDTEYPFAATFNNLTIHNRPYYHVLAQTDTSQGTYLEPGVGIIKLIIKDRGTL